MQQIMEKDITKKTLGRKLLEGEVGVLSVGDRGNDITKKIRKKVVRRRSKIVICNKHGKGI